MTAGMSARISELVAEGLPFAQATVVRVQAPTSVHAGDAAVILPDGSIEGFVGGHCTENSVRVAALDALDSGESVLLRVLPEGESAFPESEGAQVVVNPCLSGGSLEIFIQPQLPAPVIWVSGRSPIATAMGDLAGSLGFVISHAADGDGPSAATAAVISSHGGGDEVGAIRSALDAGVGYVGLVASRRRGAAVLAELDLTDDERRRVRSPVGLDIGARTAPEIALSILAEVVAMIRLHGLTPAARSVPSAPGQPQASAEPPAATSAATAIDPVCGMTVIIGPDTPHLRAGDEEFWFCGKGCRDRYAEKVEG